MLFDVASDLHVSTFRNTISWNLYKNPGSEVLVLAGDLANGANISEEVVKGALKHYEHVIWVDGNHEHYETGKTVSEETARLLSAGVGTFLNGTMTIVGKTAFIGACGWYDFKVRDDRFTVAESKLAWSKGINDARYIRFYDVQPEVRAEQDANNMARCVAIATADPNVKDIVCITHSAPNRKLAPAVSLYDIKLDGAFFNTTMDVVREADTEKKIKVWCYGHQHDRNDRLVDGIRYVNNARGYTMEPQFMSWNLVQIDTEAEILY